MWPDATSTTRLLELANGDPRPDAPWPGIASRCGDMIDLRLDPGGYRATPHAATWS